MFKKILIASLAVAVLSLTTACTNPYRVTIEGMPEELKTKLEEQVVAGEDMLAAAEDDTAKITALLEIAFAHQQLGRYDLAMPRYEEMLMLEPTNFQALNNLGVILEAVGEYEEAAHKYGALLDANPNSIEGIKDTVRVLVSAGHFDDALTTLENFMRYNNPDGTDAGIAALGSEQFEYIRNARIDASN